MAQLGGREEDQAHCESFALAVFNRADRVDRAGRADKATAVTFYAASYFFEVSWASVAPRCRASTGRLAGELGLPVSATGIGWRWLRCVAPLPMPCSAALSPRPSTLPLLMHGTFCPPAPCPGAAALWRAAGRHSAEAAGAPRPHNLCCVACRTCAALLAELVLRCMQKQRVRQACRCSAVLLDIVLDAVRQEVGQLQTPACKRLHHHVPACHAMLQLGCSISLGSMLPGALPRSTRP